MSKTDYSKINALIKARQMVDTATQKANQKGIYTDEQYIDRLRKQNKQLLINTAYNSAKSATKAREYSEWMSPVDRIQDGVKDSFAGTFGNATSTVLKADPKISGKQYLDETERLAVNKLDKQKQFNDPNNLKSLKAEFKKEFDKMMKYDPEKSEAASFKSADEYAEAKIKEASDRLMLTKEEQQVLKQQAKYKPLGFLDGLGEGMQGVLDPYDGGLTKYLGVGALNQVSGWLEKLGEADILRDVKGRSVEDQYNQSKVFDEVSKELSDGERVAKLISNTDSPLWSKNMWDPKVWNTDDIKKVGKADYVNDAYQYYEDKDRRELFNPENLTGDSVKDFVDNAINMVELYKRNPTLFASDTAGQLKYALPGVGTAALVADWSNATDEMVQAQRAKTGNYMLDDEQQSEVSKNSAGLLITQKLGQQLTKGAIKGTGIGSAVSSGTEKATGALSNAISKIPGSTSLAGSKAIGASGRLGRTGLAIGTEALGEGLQETMEGVFQAYGSGSAPNAAELGQQFGAGAAIGGGMASVGYGSNLVKDAVRDTQDTYDKVVNAEAYVSDEDSLDVTKETYDPSRVISRRADEVSTSNVTEEGLNKAKKEMDTILADSRNHLRGLRDQQAKIQRSEEIMREIKNPDLSVDEKQALKTELESIIEDVQNGPTPQELDAQITRAEESLEKAEASYMKGYRQLDDIRANKGFGEFSDPNLAEVDADGKPVPQLKEYQVSETKPSKDIKKITSDLSVNDIDAEIDSALEISETRTQELESKVANLEESDAEIGAIESRMQNLDKQIQSREIAIKQAKSPEQAESLKAIQEQAKEELRDLYDQRSALVRERTLNGTLDTKATIKELEEAKKANEALKTKATKVKEERAKKISELNKRLEQLQGKTDARSIKEYEKLSDELSELTEGRLNNKQRQVRQATREAEKAARQEAAYDRASKKLDELRERVAQISQDIESEKKGRNDTTSIGLLNQELKDVRGRIKKFEGTLKKHDKATLSKNTRQTKNTLDGLLGKKRPKKTTKAAKKGAKTVETEDGVFTREELLEQRESAETVLEATKEKLKETKKGSDTYKALEGFIKNTEARIREIDNNIRTLDGVTKERVKVTKGGNTTTEVVKDDDTLTRKLRNVLNLNKAGDDLLGIELTAQKIATLLELARVLDEMRVKENALKNSDQVTDNILNGDAENGWFGLRDYETALALAIENDDVESFNRYIGKLQIFMESHVNKSAALDKALDAQKTGGAQVVYRIKGSRTEWAVRPASKVESTGLPYKLRKTGSILVKANTAKLANTIRNEAELITDKFNTLKELQSELTEQNTGSERGKGLVGKGAGKKPTPPKTPKPKDPEGKGKGKGKGNGTGGLVQTKIKEAKELAPEYTEKKSGELADITHYFDKEDNAEYMKFNILMWAKHFKNIVEKPYDAVFNEMRAIGAIATKSIAFGTIGQYRGDFDYDRVSKGAKVDDPLYEQWVADKEATKGYQDWEAVFHEEFAGHNNSKLVYGQEYTSDDIVAVILNYSEDNAEIEAARMAEIDAAIEAGATILLPKAYKDNDKRTQDMIKYLESKGYSLAPKEKRLSRKFGSKNFKVQSFIKTGTDTGNTTDTNNTGVKTPKGLSKPISTKDKPLDVYVDGSDIKGTGAIGFGVFINHNGKEHAISGAYDTKDLKDLEKELGIKLSKAPSNAVMEFFGALIAIKNTPANEYLQISQDLEGSQLWILSGILEHLSGQQFNTKAAYTSWYKQQSPAQQKELARQVKEIIGLDPDLLAKKIFKGETESKGYYAADPTVRAIQQQIVQEILARPGKITYKWVKGHAGIEGNEKVDAVAKDRKKYNTYKDLFTSEGKKEDNTDKDNTDGNPKDEDKEDSNKEEEESSTETETKPTTIAKFFETAKKWKLPAERLFNAIKEGDWKHFPVPAIKTNVAVADGKLDVNESILQQKDTMLNSQKDFFNKYIATKDYEGLAKLLGFELTDANKRQLDAFIRLHNRISERVSEALKVPTEDQSYDDNPLYKHLVKTRPVLDKDGNPIVTKKGVARTESYLEDNVVTALALSVFQHIQTGGRNPYLDRDQIHDVHGIDEYTQINKSTQAIVSKWGSQRGFVFQDLGKGAIRALGLRAGNDADLRILNKLESELGALAYVIVTERTDDPLFISKESNEVKDSDGNPGLLTNGERIRTLVSGMSKGRAIKFLSDLSKSKYDEETGEAVISDSMMSRIKNAKNTKEIVEILKEANNSYMFSAVHLVRPAISRYWDRNNKEMVSLYNPDILDILESSKKEKGEKDLLNELFDSAYSREEPLNEKPETFDQDTVIKGSTKVPRNQHDALLKISQQEWGVETAKAVMMINLYDNNREQFYKLVGVKSDEEILAMHPSDRETAYTDRRIAMDMYEKQIAWLKGRKDDKSGSFAGYWQKPVVWVNQRVGYASTLWNAQTNMFARMLSNMKTWTTDIDINESIIPKKPSDITLHGRFFLMLAENMEGASNHMDFGEITYNGVTYPKKAYRKSAKTVDKVLPQDFLPRFLNYLETSPVIADAVSAINNLHENGSITDSESDAISKAVAELDQGELSLGALMEYAAYLRAKEAGTGTYTTTMGSQSDGITNGPMITKFLLAVASPAIRIMGGIIGKKDTAEGIIDFFETKARGYKDLYENTGSAMSKSLEQYIPQGSLLESTLATISLIDDDFGSRSWAKKLLTPFNYGSGIPRLRDAINGNVVEKFEREYKDIFAENTTKADRLKALGIFNKKLKAIATEYNDMFLHKNINEANLEVELEKLVVIHNGQRSTDKMVETSFDKDTKIQMLGELYKAAPNATPVDILNKVSYILRQSNSAVSDAAITIDQIEGDISRDILNAVDSLANITFGTAAIRSIEKEEAAYIKKRDLLTEMANLAYANYDALRRAYISEYAADPNNPTVAEMQKIDRMLASSKAAVASAMSNLGLDNNGRRAQAIASGIDLEKTTFRTSTGLKIPFNTLNREQGDKATENYSYGFTYTEMGEPGVRTLALMIQSLDAATSIQAIAEIAGMNFHDANVFGLKDLAQGVTAQNRNFFKTIIRYEPSIEIAESVLRPIYAARDLYRSKDASPLLKGRAESIMQSMRSRQDEIIEMIHSAYDNEMFKLIQSINNDEYIHQYGGLGGVYKITEADKAEMKKRYLELSKERDDKILEFTNLIENYTVPEEVEENTLEEEVTNPNNTETIVSQLKELDSLGKRALIDQALASPEINVRELISLIKELLSTTSADPKNYRGLLDTLEALNDDTLGDIKIKYVERDFEAESSGYAPSTIRYSRAQKALIVPALVTESMHNGSLVKTIHNLQNTVKQIPLEHVLREMAIATYHQNMYFIRNGSNVHPELRKAYNEMVTISDLLQYSVRFQRFFDLENEADRAAFELLEKTFTGNKFKKNPEDLIYLIQHDPAIKEALTRIPSDFGFGDVPSIFNRLKRAFIRVFTKGDLNKINAGKTLADLVFGLGDGLVNEVKALRLGTVTGNPMTVNGLIQASFDTHENPWTRQDKYDFVSHVDNRLMLELVKLKHQYKGQHIPIDAAINVVKSALLSYPLPKDGSDNNGYRDLLLGMLNVVERHRHAANAIENFVLAESIEDFEGAAVGYKYAYAAINKRGRTAYRSADGQGKGTVVFHTDTIGSGYLSAATFVHELYHAMTSPMLSNYLPENAPQKDVERSRKITEIKIELDTFRSQFVEAVNKKLAEGGLTNTQIQAITYAITGDRYYERTSLEDGTIQFVHTGITDHRNNPYQPQYDGAPAVDEFLAEFTSNKHLINVLNDIDVDMKKRKKSKDGNESISSFYDEVLNAVGALEPNGKYVKSSTNALRNFGLIYAELNHTITDGEYRETDTGLLKPYSDTFYGFNAGLSYLLPEEQAKSIANNFSKFLDGVAVPFLEQQAEAVIKEGDNVGVTPTSTISTAMPVEMYKQWEALITKVATTKNATDKFNAMLEIKVMLKQFRKTYPDYLTEILPSHLIELDPKILNAKEREVRNQAIKDLEVSSKESKVAELPFSIPPTLQESVDTAHDIKQSFVLQREEDMNADLGGAVRNEERFRPEQIADFLGTQTDRDNSYLNNIIKNVINPLMDKIPQALIEGYDYTKVWHDAIISGNAVYTSRAIDAGFDLDDQQAYVLEVLEVALLNTLNDVANTTAFRQLQRSYQQAKDTVRVEDFHNGNWNEATREEKDIAYAKYNLVFRPAVGGTSDGTSDYLSNFAALALVSPEMQRVLSFSPESVRDPAPDSIFEKLIKLFDKVVEFWDDKTTDVRSTDSINDRVASLTNTLATIYYKGHDRVVENERNRFLDLEENLAKIGDNIIEKLRAAGVVALSVPGLRDTNPAKVGRSFLEGKFKDFDKYVNHLLDYVQPNKPLNGARETFNEIVGTLEGEEHKTAVSLFHATKAIEQERGAVIEAVAKAMLEAFSSENQDMSKEEHKGITNTLLRTDAHVLLKAHGFNTVMQYVRDPSSLSTEIQRVEDILAKHPQGNEYIHRARALATYMVQKKAPNTMLAKNAYAIAERVGTGKEASYTQQDLENLDQLISLYALRQTKSEDKQAMLKVLDKEASNTNEVTGLEYLLLSHAEASKTADDLFDENPYSKIKGHVPTILNPNKGFVVVTPKEVSLYEQMGYKKADTLDQSALSDLRGERVLMTVSNTGKQRYVSGALSIEDANRSGSTVIRKGDVGFDSLVKKTQREMARAGATFFNDPSNNTNVTGNLIPAYDQNGEIIAFSYEMSGAGLDIYLDRNNNPFTLLSQYKGSNLGKKHFPQQNKRIVDFAMDQYANAQDTDKRKFVKVSPDSKNAKVRQYWNSLPKETQMYIEAKNGGQFLYIRNDELNMLMGYRKFSPGAAFDKPSFERNLLEAAYVALFELPLRGKAKLRHDQALGLWLDIIKKLKDFIAIRNFKVLWGNIKSNVAFLMLNASDPVNAIRDVKDALTYSLAYQKQAQELNQLKHEMKIGLTSPEKTARFVVLQDSIARNPLRDFIEAGMMPMIVNDMSFKQGEVEYDTALNKGIDAVYGRLPKPITTTLDYALASPGTPLYSFLSNATQQSDFVFKYAMYKQELRKGKSKEQAMAVAREVYIDYDIPTNRGVQFMNDIGLWMFTKFALRIQRALLRYAREKPGKLVGEHLVSTYVLDNPSLLSLNLANYFMGGRNPFRVPSDGVLTMWGNATPIQALYAAVN